MQTLSDKDYQTFQHLALLKQEQLLKTMSSFLKARYKKVIVTSKYICAVGDIPVALTAHMDTVFKNPPIDIYYDREKNVMWSPDGLGADDRAGIFAIIKIVQTGLKPHIILTTDEEFGAIGAYALINKMKKPFASMKYIIQLDRRGENDCVFYNCNNENFTQYVESFGFKENIGSFSDISIICPIWEVAGVNLSIGYRDEHSTSETLHITPFLSTVDKVITMLKSAKDAPVFKYISSKHYNFWKTHSEFGYKCHSCGFSYSEYEMFPVECKDGRKHYYCPDCVVNKVDWCTKCGQPFEIDDKQLTTLCFKCRDEVKIQNV